MTGVRGGRISWVDWFPIREQLIDGVNNGDDEIFIVDVGGGRGHNVEDVKKRFPDAPGRFILQDLPAVIDDVGELGKQILSHIQRPLKSP